jgi:hypothetical protein
MMMRRRRPLARAAMVGGTAYVAGRHAAKGQQRESDQEARLQELEYQAQQSQAPPAYAAQPVYAAPPPPAAPAGGTDVVAKLTELKGLLDAGVLTPAEFEAAKQKLLAQ